MLITEQLDMSWDDITVNDKQNYETMANTQHVIKSPLILHSSSDKNNMAIVKILKIWSISNSSTLLKKTIDKKALKNRGKLKWMNSLRSHVLENFSTAIGSLNKGSVVVKSKILRLLENLCSFLSKAIGLTTCSNHPQSQYFMHNGVLAHDL